MTTSACTTPSASAIAEPIAPAISVARITRATGIDCYFRRVAARAIAEHMRTELVEDAFKAARHLWGGLVGSVFHSDHRSQGEFQYTSKEFANLYKQLGVA